jgi:hypothetical protein
VAFYFTFSIAMALLYFDPEDVNGDFPKWVYIYIPIAVTSYQVPPAERFLILFHRYWTMQMGNKHEQQAIPQF